MALEDIESAGKFLGSLNRSNPVTGDEVAEGDNHIRGIKNVLLNTFPNVNAAVSATAAELDSIADGPFLPLTGGTLGGALPATDAELRYGGTGKLRIGGTQAGSVIELVNGAATTVCLQIGANFVTKVASGAASLQEVGFRDLPLGRAIVANAGPIFADRGLMVQPAGDVTFAAADGVTAGATVSFLTTASAQFIQGAGMTIKVAGGALTGTRTVAANSIITAWWQTSSIVWLNGAGIT